MARPFQELRDKLSQEEIKRAQAKCWEMLRGEGAPKSEAEWILENINEWRRGCGNTDGGHPYDCKECTVALIDVIERRAKRIAGSDKE